MTNKQIKLLGKLIAKEQVLSDIIVWLKAKGLWEELKKDLELN